MTREKEPISKERFEELKKILLLGANQSIKELGIKLLDYCWKLDNYAVSQDWEGKADTLIVFGVPEEKRKQKNTKNYFSIWKNNETSADYLKCEIIVPVSLQSRFLKDNNFKNRMYISTLPQVTGNFKLEDYSILTTLIIKAYNHRVKAQFTR